MNDCHCKCCQVYGPIPNEPDRDKTSRAIKKLAQEGIERLKREDPKAYAELEDLFSRVAK